MSSPSSTSNTTTLITTPPTLLPVNHKQQVNNFFLSIKTIPLSINQWLTSILLCPLPTNLSWLSKMAKLLFIFLFFSFPFLLSWTYYTEGSWESVMSQASHHMMSHNWSHDRHGKIVHRPYSSCISSVENLMGTLLSSLCQSLNKEQLALFWLEV